MRFRFKSMLGLIFIFIIAVIAIFIGYFFYKKVIDPSYIDVDGGITINYVNGKKFKFNGNGEIDFIVTNNSDEQLYYYIQFTDVYGTNVNYYLTSSNNVRVGNILQNEIISNQMTIAPHETVRHKIQFTNTTENAYSGVLQVGLKNDDENTFANVILKNNNVSDTYLTPLGDASTIDEGLISSIDNLGASYYFRGAVTNNNLSFAGFNWKILKINGDGSVKIVLDGIIEQISKYYDTDIDFIDSTIYNNLSTWYNDNLNNYSDYIAYYNFCNDTVLETDNTTYIAYNRIIANKIPNFVCLGSFDNLKIGLLTADEVVYAGAGTSENKAYYLYNEAIETAYYTMTSAVYSENNYYPFAINTDGSLVYNISGILLRGVRPVINIAKNTKVTGNGTKENPYKID